LEFATNSLHFGDAENVDTITKASAKWRRKPTIHLQSDFQDLLRFLFTDAFGAVIDSEFTADSNATILLRGTKLFRSVEIWNRVFSARKLQIRPGRIDVVVPSTNNNTYNAAEMSDGERGALYLIGQCLAAPEGALLLIDEPEIHIHKAIQAKLCDEVEAARPDCQFVYLTHDLQFAASRLNAVRVCLKSFDGAAWDWYQVGEGEDIPDDIYLQIIGDTKPVLFVEGDNGSLDQFLLSRIYPRYQIVPCGGCSEVISATRSFTLRRDLHGLRCAGLIDRDSRNDDELNYLQRIGVYAGDIGEIENLILLEGVLEHVVTVAHLGAPQTILSQVKTLVIEQLRKDKVDVISARAARYIEAHLRGFDAKAGGQAALQKALNDLTATIDVSDLYSSNESLVNKILANSDYDGAIKVYCNKGLVPRVSSKLGLQGKTLPQIVKNIMVEDDNSPIVISMRAAMPNLS